nr:hypothetical protein [Tanacetum cinerariifolium]
MRIKVGNGNSTSFWVDKWCIEGVLKDHFPRIRKRFFQGHDHNCKKTTWVSWSKVLSAKEKGGLGVSSLYAMNRGLLFKWIWRFYTQDKWCIEGVLKDHFPRMYALELDKNVTIADKLSQELENTGDFTIASARKVIDDKFLPSVLCKTRWNKFVPRKINVHVWKVKMDAFPTRFNMSRRGISINSILCGNCDVKAETTSHLFFSCQMARDVSKHIAHWWSVPEYEFGTYDEWSSWFEEVHLPAMNKSMFEGVFYVAWWLLWWFRNKKIFEEKAPKKERSSFMTPKKVVAHCISKVARWNACYDNEDELQTFRHKARQQDKVYEELEESCWIPHPRTGIFYLKGHEGAMNEVPDGAASFASSYWLRNSDVYRV